MFNSYTAVNVGRLFLFIFPKRFFSTLNPRMLCVGGEATAKEANLTESERSSGVRECVRVRTHIQSYTQTISTFKCEPGSSWQFMNFSIKPRAKRSCALYLFSSNLIGHPTSAETISECLLVDISDHSHRFVWPSSRKVCTRNKIFPASRRISEGWYKCKMKQSG